MCRVHQGHIGNRYEQYALAIAQEAAAAPWFMNIQFARLKEGERVRKKKRRVN
jgi:hypothetical protein